MIQIVEIIIKKKSLIMLRKQDGKKKTYLGVRVISPREIIEMDHKQCAHLNLIHVVRLLKKFHVGPTKIK